MIALPMSTSRPPSGGPRLVRRRPSRPGPSGPRGWRFCRRRRPLRSSPRRPHSARTPPGYRSARPGCRSCVRSVKGAGATRVSSPGRCPSGGYVTGTSYCPRTPSSTTPLVCVASRRSSTTVRRATVVNLVRTIRAVAAPRSDGPVGGVSGRSPACSRVCGAIGPCSAASGASRGVTRATRDRGVAVGLRRRLLKNDYWTRARTFSARVMLKHLSGVIAR